MKTMPKNHFELTGSGLYFKQNDVVMKKHWIGFMKNLVSEIYFEDKITKLKCTNVNVQESCNVLK